MPHSKRAGKWAKAHELIRFLFVRYAKKRMDELLEDQLKDLYSAETQLVKALPKMAKKAAAPNLAKAFQSHLRETEGQVARLDKIARELDVKLTGKKCAAMAGLIEEGKEVIDDEDEGPDADALLIAAAQRVEHYEISAYGTARTMAEVLGLDKVAELLQATEDEESAADEKLTDIATSELYPALCECEESEMAGAGRK
jgi:ferritin-like metal-binding protein YciE